MTGWTRDTVNLGMMMYSVETVLNVYSTQCMQYAVYAVFSICSYWCMLYLVLTHDHDMERL